MSETLEKFLPYVDTPAFVSDVCVPIGTLFGIMAIFFGLFLALNAYPTGAIVSLAIGIPFAVTGIVLFCLTARYYKKLGY
jgi:uncharacterized membrane protein YccF (DUF307 family)